MPSDEAQVAALFDAAEQAYGTPELVVFNVAGISMGNVVATDVAQFEDMWRASALGGFLIGREAARRMLPRRIGIDPVCRRHRIGQVERRVCRLRRRQAGAACRGRQLGAGTGSGGIHVGHLVIDGIIDVPRVHERMPEIAAAKGEGGLIDPSSIAATLLWLHRQPRDAWTFELDLRPFKEPW
jgi:NAD(P)-dependent dehydrogenase (short-subunit alcohol dehydrogenase family)